MNEMYIYIYSITVDHDFCTLSNTYPYIPASNLQMC